MSWPGARRVRVASELHRPVTMTGSAPLEIRLGRTVARGVAPTRGSGGVFGTVATPDPRCAGGVGCMATAAARRAPFQSPLPVNVGHDGVRSRDTGPDLDATPHAALALFLAYVGSMLQARTVDCAACMQCPHDLPAPFRAGVWHQAISCPKPVLRC